MHFADPTHERRACANTNSLTAARVQSLQAEPARRRLPPGQEHARDADIVTHGRRRQTTPLKQIRRVPLDNHLGAVPDTAGRGTGTTPKPRKYSSNGDSARRR